MYFWFAIQQLQNLISDNDIYITLKIIFKKRYLRVFEYGLAPLQFWIIWLFFLPVMVLLWLDVSDTHLYSKAQTQLKKTSESCHFSTHLTFHSVSNQSTHISISPQLQGDESCDWSAFPAGNERASLRGLFKQRVIQLRSCSRTACHVTGRPALLTQLTWLIVPYQVLISEVFLACKCGNVVICVCLLALLCSCLCTYTSF